MIDRQPVVYFLNTILGSPVTDRLGPSFCIEFLFAECDDCLECGWVGLHEEKCSKYDQKPFRTGRKVMS